MSNILKNNINTNNDYLSEILKLQYNDPICKALVRNDISIDLINEIEIFDNNGVSLGFFELEEIFDYLINKFPFIVTVPEIYGKQILDEGLLTPVSPNDNPDICGFKGTLGRDPFIQKINGEKRYIVKINDIHKKNIYPYLNTGINKSFRGVSFFPLNSLENLSLGVDYEILGLYSADDISNMKIKNQVSNTKEVVSNIFN